MPEAYPLTWPEGWKRTRIPERSRFKINYFSIARDTLLAEIRRMGGSNVVLSTNVALRLDGLPYANLAEPKDSGAAVYFKYKNKAMCFACDTFRTVKENLYAMAKTIEALRGIERWGASQMMERAFTGFAQLPASTSSNPWREVLGFGLAARPNRDEIEHAYKTRALQHHPDQGGDRSKFEALVTAKREAFADLGLN